MESTLQERVNIGREYEEHCYSMCYYLVQDERLAFKAAQAVMKRLIQNESFNMGSALNIGQYIKKESMKESVQVMYSEE